MSKFNDYNIVYIVVEDMPNNGDPWQNEVFQRNAIMRGLRNAEDWGGDIIIISDCDEIPRKEVVESFMWTQFGDGKDFAALKMDMYSYYLNCVQGYQSWDRCRIMRRDYLEGKSPNEVRNSGYVHEYENAGWHFSYMGGVEKIQEKLNSFSHQEVNTPLLNNEEVLKYKLEKGQSLWSSEPDDLWEFVEIDHTFPQYLGENQDQFKHMIKQL